MLPYYMDYCIGYKLLWRFGASVILIWAFGVIGDLDSSWVQVALGASYLASCLGCKLLWYKLLWCLIGSLLPLLIWVQVALGAILVLVASRAIGDLGAIGFRCH